MKYLMKYLKPLISCFMTLAIALVLTLGYGIFASPPAMAMISEHEEAPGQILYKSLWSLRDEHHQSWQAIAFKQVYPDRKSDVYLRLVGFPGAVSLDHSQPLTLTNAAETNVTEHSFTLADESGSLFPGNKSSAPNVGQYRLQTVLPKLRPELPLELSVMQIDGEVVHLHVPPWLVHEWQQLLLK